MTQEDLADRAGLNSSRIGTAEVGRSNLTYSSLRNISDALGVSFAELAELVDQMLRGQGPT